MIRRQWIYRGGKAAGCHRSEQTGQKNQIQAESQADANQEDVCRRAMESKEEHQKSSVRAKVEHVFAVIKGQFRYRKTRYRGLPKQTAKLNMLFALANLVLDDRHCPVA